MIHFFLMKDFHGSKSQGKFFQNLPKNIKTDICCVHTFLLYLIKQSSELFGKVVKPPAMRVRIEKLIALFENKKPPCYNKLSRPDETY